MRLSHKNNKFTLRRLLTAGAMALALTLTSGLTSAEECPTSDVEDSRPGLLILSHGSPSPKWNEKVNRLVETVREINRDRAVFHAVEGAFLEFAQPDARSGIEKLEDAGCDRIVVVPAFIFPTSHSHFDVPAVLGIYTSPSVRATLQEENATVAHARVPIVVTQTLSESDLLAHYVLDEVKAISKHPESEALLVIAHGDAAHEGLITPVMKRITHGAAEAVNLAESDWCYCGMGQQYKKDVLPALKKLSRDGNSVLIVGVYLASSAKDIHHTKPGSHSSSPSSNQEDEPSQNDFQEMNLILSERPLLDHPETAPTVFNIAVSALQ
ncbi:MAG: CbiX/SirB N-terminal domain-containing protein [Planctomycetia bacterium]|nr:CbiX/SirB N-terminal domain-containing protein [Planctomycetia bacterium]